MDWTEHTCIPDTIDLQMTGTSYNWFNARFTDNPLAECYLDIISGDSPTWYVYYGPCSGLTPIAFGTGNGHFNLLPTTRPSLFHIAFSGVSNPGTVRLRLLPHS